jgi:hypothetical protein
MTAFRFFVILVIFGAATAAWAVLGSTLEYRTADLSQSLGKTVDDRWGPSGLVQEPPTVLPPADGDGKPGGAGGVPVRSDIRVTFDHADRYKGLLWFSTYSVQFSGTYTVPSPAAAGGEFLFHLPENGPVPENLRGTASTTRTSSGSPRSPGWRNLTSATASSAAPSSSAFARPCGKWCGSSSARTSRTTTQLGAAGLRTRRAIGHGAVRSLVCCAVGTETHRAKA